MTLYEEMRSSQNCKECGHLVLFRINLKKSLTLNLVKRLIDYQKDIQNVS